METVHGQRVLALSDARFGRLIEVSDGRGLVESVERSPDVLLGVADGLLVLKGMGAISEDPELLIRLSIPFGEEVENYALTPNRLSLLHPASTRIIRIPNRPPMNYAPPELPDPPRTADGELPAQFPHRRGWHTQIEVLTQNP